MGCYTSFEEYIDDQIMPDTLDKLEELDGYDREFVYDHCRYEGNVGGGMTDREFVESALDAFGGDLPGFLGDIIEIDWNGSALNLERIYLDMDYCVYEDVYGWCLGGSEVDWDELVEDALADLEDEDEDE